MPQWFKLWNYLYFLFVEIKGRRYGNDHRIDSGRRAYTLDNCSRRCGGITLKKFIIYGLEAVEKKNVTVAFVWCWVGGAWEGERYDGFQNYLRATITVNLETLYEVPLVFARLFKTRHQHVVTYIVQQQQRRRRSRRSRRRRWVA